MQRYLFAIVCVLILFQNLPAQEDTTHHASGKALLFSFQGLNLGGGLGGKYWLDDNYALRGIVTGSYQNIQSNNYLQYPYQDNYNDLLYSLSLAIGLEKHFSVSHALSPYIGVNGTVNWSQTTYKDIYIDSTTQHITSSRGFGGSFVIGAEYWIASWISLAGEKTFGVSYSTSSGNTSVSNFYVTSSTSALMLLIYL